MNNLKVLKKPKNLSYFAVLSIWLVVICVYGTAMTAYSHIPGKGSDLAGSAPIESRIQFDTDQDNLIVFIHPKCSCSKATLWELNRLLPEVRKKMAVTVIFERPLGAASEWVEGENLEFAKSLPGVRLLMDVGGKEFSRFHVKTSGQVMLFSADRELLFSGGITPSRAHMGESDGRAVILERAREGRILARFAAVFGCETTSEK